MQAGLEVMRSAFDKAGDSRFLPRYMLLLGEYAATIGRSGQHRLGLDTIDEMLARCKRTEERWYEPELRRVRGELLVLHSAANSAEEAERQFLQATGLAGRHQPCQAAARCRRHRGSRKPAFQRV